MKVCSFIHGKLVSCLTGLFAIVLVASERSESYVIPSESDTDYFRRLRKTVVSTRTELKWIETNYLHVIELPESKRLMLSEILSEMRPETKLSGGISIAPAFGNILVTLAKDLYLEVEWRDPTIVLARVHEPGVYNLEWKCYQFRNTAFSRSLLRHVGLVKKVHLLSPKKATGPD
jgi:hypothetical protein